MAVSDRGRCCALESFSFLIPATNVFHSVEMGLLPRLSRVTRVNSMHVTWLVKVKVGCILQQGYMGGCVQ